MQIVLSNHGDFLKLTDAYVMAHQGNITYSSVIFIPFSLLIPNPIF